MSGVQLDKPADPFNTEGLAAPPRDGPATAAAPSGGIGVAAPMAVGEAKPAGVEFSADAGTGAGAGAGPAGADQPMTNLLGVVDAQATPTTAPAAAPALTAGSAAIDGNGKSDAAPVQATSAVGGAPAVPAPVPASATPPASDAAAGNVLGAAPAPAAAPSGDTGATKIGGGRPLGEAQAQAAKEPASPLQSPPIQEEEPRPAPSQQQQQQQQCVSAPWVDPPSTEFGPADSVG